MLPKFNAFFRKKQNQCCTFFSIYSGVINSDHLDYQNYWYFGFYIFRIPASRTNEHLVDCLPEFYLCLALSKTNNANLSLSKRIQIKALFTYQKDSMPFSYNNFFIYKLFVRYSNYIYNINVSQGSVNYSYSNLALWPIFVEFIT